MDLFFNEASLKTKAPDRKSALQRMDNAVMLLRECSRHGIGTLRTLSGLLGWELCPSYTIRHWLGDNSVELEKRSRFKTAATRGPFIEELLEQKQDENAVVYEFRFKDEVVFGLGVAWIADTASVSLQGNPELEVDPVEITVTTVGKDSDLESQKASVRNLCKVAQVASRLPWLIDRLQVDVPNGMVAWEKHSELFPNLDFCAGAADALQAMSGKEKYFNQVCRHLFALNSFCANLPSHGLDQLKAITWSNESDSTMNNSKLSKMREFNCPDGKRRVFSPHSKPTGGSIRIHFLPVPEKDRILIGYIGAHLPY